MCLRLTKSVIQLGINIIVFTILFRRINFVIIFALLYSACLYLQNMYNYNILLTCPKIKMSDKKRMKYPG